MSFVYLLESSISKTTYVGATTNLNRRLRQHNKEIKGGAFITGAKVSRGETWRRVCYIKGFPDWTATLQFEWRWKHLTRRITGKMSPLEKRKDALMQLLLLDRPTSKAQAYNEWTEQPEVIWEPIIETVE